MLIAKFTCESVENSGGDEQVTLDAVYSDDENDPNKSWSEATPYGRLNMTISNPDAQGKFERGKEYFLRIEPA